MPDDDLGAGRLECGVLDDLAGGPVVAEVREPAGGDRGLRESDDDAEVGAVRVLVAADGAAVLVSFGDLGEGAAGGVGGGV